ncbi:hypothetical protein C0995_002352 [Termitomyces sp. Mi166|nr:hypothetical protein C0995_002352 [Termitomyces sp. Mi166\
MDLTTSVEISTFECHAPAGSSNLLYYWFKAVSPSPELKKINAFSHYWEFVPCLSTTTETAENAVTKLRVVFKKVEDYRHLLSCSSDDAQKLLDTFQVLLDTKCFHDRGQLIAAMQRLSERAKLYPARFSLNGPSPSLETKPVASGSFADIYKITFRDEETCYKVIRVYAKEAILWAQLSHPNILPFYGLLKFRSRIAFVSHWATNGNLEEYLTHNPNANRMLLCMDTAAGVEYLHKNDIVHGDLKGLNVLIDSSGRASLGDFGISSVNDPQILKWASQSTMASKGGTVRWQAPELLGSEDIKGKIHNSKASDIFAWANICYEIFIGHLPFYEDSNQATVMLSILRGENPSRPPDDDDAWLKHRMNEYIWGLLKECWNFQPLKHPNMTTVISRLNIERPIGSRPPGEWAPDAAVRFRNANAQDAHLLKDMGPFWEELGSLLSRIVPGIEETSVDI